MDEWFLRSENALKIELSVKTKKKAYDTKTDCMDNHVISVEQNWRGRNFDENSCRKGKAVSLLNFNLRAVRSVFQINMIP